MRGQGHVRCFVICTLVSGCFSFGLIVVLGWPGVVYGCFRLFWQQWCFLRLESQRVVFLRWELDLCVYVQGGVLRCQEHRALCQDTCFLTGS